ncbi:MAG: M67 family metallopeptidase [Actinomycetota bacterium]
MLRFERSDWLAMLAEAWARYPLEACGLLVGRPGPTPDQDVVERFVPIHNEAASSRIYRLDGREYARAALAADDDGLDIVGVMHSHTHTAAYPSATDVAEASKPLVPPTWHWVIVSLALGFPELHSFRIEDGGIREESVGLIEVNPY